MKRFINLLFKFPEFFQDGPGGFSAMRLLLLTWGLGGFAIWAVLCIATHTFVPLNPLYTAFVASLTAGKLIQNNSENKAAEIAAAVPPLVVEPPKQ